MRIAETLVVKVFEFLPIVLLALVPRIQQISKKGARSALPK